jgi:hypothetical protein
MIIVARQAIENITALPPARTALLIGLDALDKEALLREEPIDIGQAAEILGIGEQKVVECCNDKEFPLPHDQLAKKYIFYPTLIRWWRLNRQKVR